ncbi:MAG TPA: serine hydrolase domain-containing protein [Candidatus Latescibacteria bacterium]|jgi:CubicO group peptidase (beta-lactamase class C family)|nr:hypothetical protein [Gemmatimonadaceae bacterium]HJP31740.1 serine hydrolase domain-containing protein [Candidatus Latescibacterota bacterium]
MAATEDAPSGLRHGTPTDAGFDSRRLANVWDLLDTWQRDGLVPGATIAIARNGVQLESRAFGSGLNSGNRSPMVPDQVFLVASVTKPVTAIAVMQLVERGLICLSDPVAQHVPEFVGPGKERIRIEHLLTHTSGLPDMLPANEALRSRQAQLPEFVREVCSCDLLFPAGTRVSYQSMGTLLAGEVVERITGRPLRQVMEEEIFLPLQMGSTALGMRQDLASRATDVNLPDEQMASRYHWNTEYWQGLGAPWGGMFSTVDDIVRLLAATLSGGALAGGRILGAATNRASISDRTEGMPGLSEQDRRKRRWGLGWRLGAWGELDSPRSFSHGGATGTLVGADPHTGLMCAVFTTQPGAPLQKAVTAVQAAVLE